MAESYSLILNSQNAKNKTGASINDLSYYVNWDSVLPTNNKGFKVTWTLKSVNTATVLTEDSLVSVTLGKTNTFDQTNCQTNILGLIHPSNYGIYYYLSSSVFDNTYTIIQYPSDNLITVKFSDFDLSSAFTMIDYVLILTFESF